MKSENVDNILINQQNKNNFSGVTLGEKIETQPHTHLFNMPLF
jgi:hypothetical protein